MADHAHGSHMTSGVRNPTIRNLVHAAGERESTSSKTGKVTEISQDFDDKKLARVRIEFGNGSNKEVPTLSDTITVSKKQADELSLDDMVKVTTVITKVS